jgi:predicted RNA methylase
MKVKKCSSLLFGGNTVQLNHYIYNVNYQEYEQDLCELEMRALFNTPITNKYLSSEKKIDPSISPFIKFRIETLYQHVSFSELLAWISLHGFDSEDFVVLYISIESNDPHLVNKREICKQIGHRMPGFPLYKNPKNTFTISFADGNWIFGRYSINHAAWRIHNQRPHSYSSSINIHIAKALLNIAANGDLSKEIIDPCCGVGTVLLEGAISGYDIEGWELNPKIADNARDNLIHFGYSPRVTTGNMIDVQKHYDASIVDLPYGILNFKDQENQQLIIKNAIRISDKIVFVTAEDISEILAEQKIKLLDFCKVRKNTKGYFSRYIWVCKVEKHKYKTVEK